MNLNLLFRPRSIAIVGASRDSKKVGASMLKNLLDGGYTGRVYPINPKTSMIQGLKAYGRLADVRSHIDLAIIAVPVPLVIPMVIEAGKKRIPFVIIVTSGFSETGKHGDMQQQHVFRVAKKYGIRIVGPNCLGLISTQHKMNISFAGRMPAQGTVSCISQSGALLVGMMDWSRTSGLGFRHLISLGNQVDVSEIDMLEYLEHDKRTSVIGIYSEQISDLKRFRTVVARIARKKPVVMLRAGISEQGAKAIASHTGSLAKSADIMSAIMRQAGVVQVNGIEDFFKVLALYSKTPKIMLRSVVIVTNAGGPGVLAADAFSSAGIPLLKLPEKTLSRLKKALPYGVAMTNPIDLMGDADIVRFKKTLNVLRDVPECDTCVVVITPQRMTSVEAIARLLVTFQKKSTMRIIACCIGGPAFIKARKILQEGSVTHFYYPEEAAGSLSQVYKPSLLSIGQQVAPKSNSLPDGMRSMPYGTMQRLLSRYGFPIVRSSLVRSIAELRKVRTYPIALKALSSKALHKARAGAVRLDIPNEAAARQALRSLLRTFSGIGFEGVLAQPMVPRGIECILGLKRDEQVGMVIVFGIGGSYAEQVHDIALHIGRLRDHKAAQKLVDQIKNQHFLVGCDRRTIARLLKQLSDFGEQHPEIVEVDLNPVVVYDKGGVIVDARCIIAD